MRIRRATLSIVVAAVMLAAYSASAVAATERAGWELTASSYPTNFARGGVDEVYEVEVSGGAGTFTLFYEGTETRETPPLPEHATDGEVQAALEGLSNIGTGNVAVTGGTPGKYRIEFVGALGNTKVGELGASGATASLTTEGAASGTIGINVFNIGAQASEGVTTVTDTLPPGLKAKEAGQLRSPGFSGINFGVDPAIAQGGFWNCSGNGAGPSPHVAGATVVTCTNGGGFAGGGGTLTYHLESNNYQPVIGIAVEAEPRAEERTKSGAEGNHVVVAGGGAFGPASTVDPVTISSTPAHGGLVQADAWFSNADGTVDRQAGSHPYAATFVFNVATALGEATKEGYLPGSEIRDLETQVPPGLVGDLHKVAQCTRQQLFGQECPPASMVGRLGVQTFGLAIVEQIYNMVPQPGTPAELGFNYGGVPVYINFTVKTGSDYSVVAHVNDIPQRIAYQSVLTLWGVPGESSHNIWRHGEGGCSQEQMEAPPFNGTSLNYCRVQATPALVPILRLPTSCGAAQPFAFRELNGWQEPNAKSAVEFLSHDALDRPAGLSGCEQITTEPTITTSPETASADSPTGLAVEVNPPLGGFEVADAFAPADIENTAVTLPEGLVINPGQAAGLQACPAGRPGPGHFANALTTAEEAARGEEDADASSCSQASKVGTVTVKSPVIEADAEKQFEGNVYVLPSNPPEVKLLVAASADGVNLKLVGTVHLNEQTGRLQTTFSSTPQLPFSHLELSFEGGARAALDTPTKCGSNVAEADFTPWSSPASKDWLQTSVFSTVEGPGGSACPGTPLPFAPALTVGSTSDQAGAFTSLKMQLLRGDGTQRVEKLQFTAPGGLAGMISSVPLCPDPQAQNGSCPESSQIGHAVVTSGPGTNPLTIPQPGDPAPAIYLTGPYQGAPFGLSIVTQVLAGPFNLGTIVTRAKIEIDPHTAQVTITTDPLPQIVDGVPTDLRSIEAIVDRPGFVFNPTSCEEASFAGSAGGTGPPGANEPGATTRLASRFQVGSCRSLAFAPQLSVATGAHATKANGQSLSVKISYPKDAVGSQSWFKEAKLDIPKQLPAEVRTLQQACLAATFEANRALCPVHSKIGTALVHTSVLPVPLEGPVYFVSHGGAKFPDVVMVLSGDNVNITLTGETLIKNGVTSATFRNLPDVPFESFEVKLPTGEYSEFGGYVAGANHYDFCGQKLSVPTFLKAQNGLEIRESVPVAVQGCSTRFSVSSARIKGHTLTLSVYVPAAGKLKAGGQGLSTVTKAAHGQELVTLSLRAKRSGSFRTKVKLSYSPTKGKKQSASRKLRL